MRGVPEIGGSGGARALGSGLRRGGGTGTGLGGVPACRERGEAESGPRDRSSVTVILPRGMLPKSGILLVKGKLIFFGKKKKK